MTPEKIEELAALAQRLIDFDRPEDTADLGRLGVRDSPLMNLAITLLQGLPYRMITDNPATAEQSREMARHLGSTERDASKQDGLTDIVFLPPARHLKRIGNRRPHLGSD